MVIVFAQLPFFLYLCHAKECVTNYNYPIQYEKDPCNPVGSCCMQHGICD